MIELQPGPAPHERPVGPCPRIRIDLPPIGFYLMMPVYKDCTGTLTERIRGNVRIVLCSECDPH